MKEQILDSTLKPYNRDIGIIWIGGWVGGGVEGSREHSHETEKKIHFKIKKGCLKVPDMQN